MFDSETFEFYAPVHPGAILREEFVDPLGLTAGRIAKACGLAETLVSRILAEQTGISGDTALRLARFFSTTPQFWMNLQQHHDLEAAAVAIGPAIEHILPIRAA